VKLDLVQTVAFSGIVLFAGYGLKRLIPLLARYNIPAPVVGGLPIAALMTLAYVRSWQPIVFDTTLQTPLMIAFFTSVGFGASITLLRRGGPLVIGFMVLSTLVAAAQNVVGGFAAIALDQHPLMGVLAGSVTLTGGPATGLAFAPLFEQAGVAGASTLAVAAAMVGIVAGGLLGGPIGTFLIERKRIATRARAAAVRSTAPAPGGAPVPPASTLENLAEPQFPEPVPAVAAGEDVEAYGLVKHLVLMMTAMGIGAWVSGWMASAGLTLPAYIGAMIVAAVFRNVDDATRVLGISQRTIDDLGTVALALFLVMALMTLRLWELAGLAMPLVIILAIQVALVALVCVLVIPPLMGRDYDSVVMAGGFCGFMLGTTANAMANMGALVERYGPAPKAYLVVPLVGAFFIDFANALLITVALNVWQ
jgi:ESS family glutamate:Na+ symporter